MLWARILRQQESMCVTFFFFWLCGLHKKEILATYIQQNVHVADAKKQK